MEVNVALCVPQRKMPSDYRPLIVSLFKAVLSRHYPSDYEQMYESGNRSKNFTFALRLPEPVFSGDELSIANEHVNLTISSGDEYYSLLFYNAFQKSVGYSHPLTKGGTMVIRTVALQAQPTLTGRTAVIKFISPLVVRRHESGVADQYYIYDDPEFDSCLSFVVDRQLGRKVEFRLEPIEPRKTVARCFGVKIRCSLGSYRLWAEPEDLNALTKSGIGSRRSEGFGFFKVVGG